MSFVIDSGWALRQEGRAECLQQQQSLRLSVPHPGAPGAGVGVGRLQPPSLH